MSLVKPTSSGDLGCPPLAELSRIAFSRPTPKEGQRLLKRRVHSAPAGQWSLAKPTTKLRTMSDTSFVCDTCGETHEGLPTDYGFRLPDEVHALSYLSRYQRSRSNADLCTLDEHRHFIRGVISIPLLEQDDSYGWGVWVELAKDKHDEYLAGFNADLSATPRFPGRIANIIPGYPDTTGMLIEVQFSTEGARPSFHFPAETSHALAIEQRNGITHKRHHDILRATGFFDKKDEDA